MVQVSRQAVADKHTMPRMTCACDVGDVGRRELPAVVACGRDARRTLRHAAVIKMVQESGATFDFFCHGGAADLSERCAGMCGDGVGCWDGICWCEERDG